MVRYDGRGYGYFSLIKPDDKDEEYCPCGDLPLRLCECSTEWENYDELEPDEED